MQYDTAAAAATTRSMDGNDVSCVVCVARMPGERPTVLSLEDEGRERCSWKAELNVDF